MASSLVRIPPLVFPALSRHTATMIFMHGLGDTGAGWTSAVENWRLRNRLNEVKCRSKLELRANSFSSKRSPKIKTFF